MCCTVLVVVGCVCMCAFTFYIIFILHYLVVAAARLQEQRVHVVIVQQARKLRGILLRARRQPDLRPARQLLRLSAAHSAEHQRVGLVASPGEHAAQRTVHESLAALPKLAW